MGLVVGSSSVAAGSLFFFFFFFVGTSSFGSGIRSAEAEATVAVASAAAFARATSSWPEAVEVLAGVGEGADAAAVGSVPAVAAADVEPPIGGAESRGMASITGELGALDAMEQGEELGETGAREIWGRRELGFANGA